MASKVSRPTLAGFAGQEAGRRDGIRRWDVVTTLYGRLQVVIDE
ncbi:MAG: hypothetical protein AVDCRST_MAG87-331 [uncultured Thermomicrobiales bacterium]|uniref:Uncharacterized protein n=1 Tax=uncultured Thermomicrobiales bacterium TaxID=1645740 RepID=A0A6J4UBW4_9BACT|nr:MAG: hypothetical protein AVDCRST_MAG87-331 [uncultured Thermomicrobiales bacterium]